MQDIVLDYELVLIGKEKKIPVHHFCENGVTNEKLVCEVIKYLIEKVMHWTPDDAADLLTMEVLKTFKVTPLLTKYIEFIPCMSDKDKCRYLVSRCYPNEINFSKKKVVLNTYNEILSGSREKWEKKYFLGKDGLVRACVCMQAAINRYLYGNTIEELYKFFADYTNGNKFIVDAKLKKPFSQLYDLPIDYFHYSLLKEQRDDFLYNYYRFMNYYEKKLKETNRSAEADTLTLSCNDSKD